MPSQVLSIAVCLFPGVTTLDYLGPMELFGFLATQRPVPLPADVSFEITYLATTKAPIQPGSGPLFDANHTFEEIIREGRQFDILFVPGGGQPEIEAVPAELKEFLKAQIPGAKYVLSACTGSWILAETGVLNGRRATSNKFLFNHVKSVTSPKIDWVAKARWVVDGNIWTSSGVTAGMDMANAFLIHLVGEETTRTIRNIIEFTPKGQGDDEFAEIYGLV